jgi:methylmalonyl-CoA carboxyltransferase large subunit
MGKAIEEDLAGLLEHVQAQVEMLQARLDQLEGAQNALGPAARQAVAPAALSAEPVKAEIAEEEVLAISAALAAYLGVRVHIRQIRLVSSHAWAQEGRVSIQASHRLHS